MKKMRTRRLPPEERLAGLHQIMLRIGRDARERLEWVVNLVQKNPAEMTEGDRDNVGVELAAFIHLGNPLPKEYADRLRAYGVEVGKGKIKLSPIEANDIAPVLERLRRNIKHVVKRENHYPADKSGQVWRMWNEPLNKWEAVSLRDSSEADSAAFALDRLVGEVGHLAKECPAPAVRAKSDEVCGRWFVAKRPTQDYCSSTCQSRASTRAARGGTDTAATRQRRADAATK